MLSAQHSATLCPSASLPASGGIGDVTVLSYSIYQDLKKRRKQGKVTHPDFSSALSMIFGCFCSCVIAIVQIVAE